MKKIIPIGNVLIMMVGPSGAGKSTFVETHFTPNEVVSSDAIREELTGQFQRLDKDDLVFQEFHRRIQWRLQAGQRAIADATHLRDAVRKATARTAQDMGISVVYVVVNRPVEQKLGTAGWRENVRIKGRSLIEAHEETFVANEKKILAGDGVANLVVDTRVDDFHIIKALPRDPSKFLNHLTSEKFRYIRVIGDVHGNKSGLDEALRGVTTDNDTFFLFLGDVVDYGKYTLETTSVVSGLVSEGRAISIRGNHERKVMNFIQQERSGIGFQGRESHGNAVTFNILKSLSPSDRRRWENQFIGLVELSPDWIQIGSDWIFVHAAVDNKMWDEPLFRTHKNSNLERMALYGETTGQNGPDGFPERLYNWVDQIRPRKHAVVGHAIRSVRNPIEVRGSGGGTAHFVDTGSSKELNGEAGKLSWMDLNIIHKDGKYGPEFDIEFIKYGSE